MYRTTSGQSVSFAVCVVVAIVSFHRSAAAAEPETQTFTFALAITATSADDIHLVGEETIGILFGKLLSPTGSLCFASGSPACEGFELDGTCWTQRLFDRMMIVNEGGPIGASVYTLNGPAPPQNSVLLLRDIKELRGCWIKLGGSGEYYVQDEFTYETAAAFFVVTAESVMNGP